MCQMSVFVAVHSVGAVVLSQMSSQLTKLKDKTLSMCGGPQDFVDVKRGSCLILGIGGNR